MQNKDGSKRTPNALNLGLLAAGGALTVFGLARRSWTGTALAAAGGMLAYRGARDSGVADRVIPRFRGWSGVRVQRTMTVNRSPEEVYRFWRDFENLPRFMRHLQSVSALAERRTRWVAKGPMGVQLEWEADFVEDEPRSISWCSVNGSQIETSGFVQFTAAADNRGTEVRVSLEYKPVAGPVGSALAALFGKEPSQTVREELRHFKQLVETGEIPTTQGQPSGRRSKIVKMVERIRQRQTGAAAQRPTAFREPQTAERL